MADKIYTLNGKKGVWRTIGGRRVFISDGDDLPTAMNKSGKFDNVKFKKVKDEVVKRKGVTAEEYRKAEDNLAQKKAEYEVMKQRGEEIKKEANYHGEKGYDINDVEDELREAQKKYDDLMSKDGHIERKYKMPSFNEKLEAESPNKLGNKKSNYWNSIKAGEIAEAGKSNRKEVSTNIQAHIKDYYDSPEDFVNQMEAMKDYSHPTAWSWGQEYARGGGYLIYNSDMEDFLNTLNINPKGKKFNDEQVFNNYTALIGRESAKMYENIRKDAVKTLTERYSGTVDYLKETENMSTSEILELLKKLEK